MAIHMLTHQRPLDWSRALRDIDAERAARPDVREEATRLAGVTAWRGCSGRRYVASVRPLDAAIGTAPAVLLAVHRGEANRATLVAVAAVRSEAALAGFLDLARATGATEVHSHTLSVAPAARAEAVRDLSIGAAFQPATERAALASAEAYDRRAIMASAVGLARIGRDFTGRPWAACMREALRAAWAAARRQRATQAA